MFVCFLFCLSSRVHQQAHCGTLMNAMTALLVPKRKFGNTWRGVVCYMQKDVKFEYWDIELELEAADRCQAGARN